MTQLRLFFLVLLINALVVLLYMVWNVLICKKKNRSFLLCSLVMLLRFPSPGTSVFAAFV